MRIGSLFSGIGGFDEGFHRACMDIAWQCESDQQCLSVLRNHYPNTKTFKDVSNVTAPIEPVELLCGGFPCQDLSVAGRRAGLAGERSGLFHEFMRIAAECSPSPRWIVIENVPGLLSSNGGRDMATVLGALEELGYGWAYRCLDSQFFGVPQRRRRIFIVGHLGDWRPAAKVLFECESVSGNFKTRRESGEEVAGGIAGSLGRVCETVTSKWAKGSGGPAGNECQNLVAQTYDMRGNGNGEIVNSLTGDHLNRPTDYTPCVAFDTTQITSKENGCNPQSGDPCHPLASGAHAPAVAFQSNLGSQSGDVYTDGSCGTLRVGSGLEIPSPPAVAIQNATRGKDQNGLGVSDPNDPMFTLDQGSQHAVALTSKGNGECWESEVHTSLSAEGGGQAGQGYPAVRTGMQVRRLTPRECERLQGFPDDWTRWGRTKDGEIKEIADGPRYKMLGNAVTVQVAEWIGRRIMEVEQC